MTHWRDYESKIKLSELPPVEQAETFGAILARWLTRRRPRREFTQTESYLILDCAVIIGSGAGA